ncbi:MAG: hypothetical protein COX91_03160, partial [Candidatus Nealsonbacteria bacterium CG_4_10_14_0_2_um_filter_39_15]
KINRRAPRSGARREMRRSLSDHRARRSRAKVSSKKRVSSLALIAFGQMKANSKGGKLHRSLNPEGMKGEMKANSKGGKLHRSQPLS